MKAEIGFDEIGTPVLHLVTDKEYSQKLIQKILYDLNMYNYDDLDSYLMNVDWFSISPKDIVPRPKVRAFIKAIDDNQTRLAVMKFFLKYGDYYFQDITKSSD